MHETNNGVFWPYQTVPNRTLDLLSFSIDRYLQASTFPGFLVMLNTGTTVDKPPNNAALF